MEGGGDVAPLTPDQKSCDRVQQPTSKNQFFGGEIDLARGTFYHWEWDVPPPLIRKVSLSTTSEFFTSFLLLRVGAGAPSMGGSSCRPPP